MSKAEIAPVTATTRPQASELSAQTIYDKCMALAHNLWWTWHPEVINLFRDLDPIRWRQLDHNPIALLAEFTPERLEMRAAELVLYSRINYAYRRLKEYMNNKQTWARTHAGVLGSKPVAYFSAEFGIHESVPIYSGGLGVLSGDHIKSASGLGIPLVAIGLFYDQGYFKQHLDAERLSTRGISRHQGRKRADGAGPRSGGQARHRARSTPAPANCWPRCG